MWKGGYKMSKIQNFEYQYTLHKIKQLVFVSYCFSIISVKIFFFQLKIMIFFLYNNSLLATFEYINIYIYNFFSFEESI